jgi:hypothetical protein
MAIYSMNRWASNKAQVCKDNGCYDVDASSITSTWRAVQWDGTSGNAELCDGIDYDVNTGEQALSDESELSALASLWQSAYDADQAAIAEAEAAAAAEEETPA